MTYYETAQAPNGVNYFKQVEKFPNGFTSWAETHFEIASYISRMSDDGGVIDFVHNMGGVGAVYELAEQWADEFEEMNKDRADWDGEWFDKIEAFCSLKNNPNYKH